MLIELFERSYCKKPIKTQLHQCHFDFKRDLKLYLSRFKAKKRQKEF